MLSRLNIHILAHVLSIKVNENVIWKACLSVQRLWVTLDVRVTNLATRCFFTEVIPATLIKAVTTESYMESYVKL
jgi:hypothetical protein